MGRTLYDPQYLDYIDLDRVPGESDYLIETHKPRKFKVAYHNHASIELNYLDDCRMDYSFSGAPVAVPEGRLTVFWGANPHAVTDVSGPGSIFNIYISFARVLQWGLPRSFTDPLFAGRVLCAHDRQDLDKPLLERWLRDSEHRDIAWKKLVLGEIESRFRRFALEAWTVLGDEPEPVSLESGTAADHVGRMLQYISDRYAEPLSVADVAAHAEISPNHAMSLFRRVVGVPIKVHIIRIRLSHAQMMLANTEKKVADIAMDAGFGSLSSFYDAFQTHMNSTPAEFRKQARGA